jgi:hypothetical protein
VGVILAGRAAPTENRDVFREGNVYLKYFALARRVLLVVLIAAVGLAAGPATGRPSFTTRKGISAVTDPVSVGWDGGCVVCGLSPLTGKWTTWKAPEAPLPRTVLTAVGPHAAAALVPDDNYGGWLLDLDTGKWSGVPASPIVRPRGALDPIAAVFVGDELIVWGADDGDTQGAALDTRTLKWRALPNAPVVPRYRCLAGVVGSKLMVWGGYGPVGRGRSGPLEDGAVYNASENTWAKMPAAPVHGIRYGCAGVVANGRLVIVGGRGGDQFRRTGMAFDPAAGTWDTIADAPVDVGVNAAVAANADRLVVWSGSPGKGAGGGATAEGAAYDFRTRRWQKLPEAPIPPRMLAFARCHGTRLTVWGGWLSSGHPATFLTDGATYDFETGAWEKTPRLPAETPYAMHPGW